ncbi:MULTISPECIES: hypothetical protein [unclassified Streptomyces]|uniref:hypothetical protein n=1 Tax=unclassified Streptomyces TaxID=2593676 RepID=UPI003D712CD8
MTDNLPSLAPPPGLRRLPWTTPEGKPCLVPHGKGFINSLADATEEDIVATALDQGAGAVLDAGRPEATVEELRKGVRFLGHLLNDVIRVAVLRGERLAHLETSEA